MGNLPKYDVMKDDDVEAQRRQHSRWLFKVEQTLGEKEDVQCPFGFQILKVPEFHRQPPEQFMPQAWRLGLHNGENLDTGGNGCEALKLSIAEALGFMGEEWLRFCDYVVPNPQDMLICYGLHEDVYTMNDEVIKQMLALDALFLAMKIDLWFERGGRELWIARLVKLKDSKMFHFRNRRWGAFAALDLCKIENQIPLDLIKRAIQYIKDRVNPQNENGDNQGSSTSGNGQVLDPYVEKWIKSAAKEATSPFMDISDGFYEAEGCNLNLSGSDHILDAAYKAICGVNGMQRESDDSQEFYINVPSATKIRDAGIKIEGVDKPLCEMSYDKKKRHLLLPKMRLFDETVGIIRNVARYEKYSGGRKCMLHDYIFLMLDLIETPEDFKLLTKCGVVFNGCGSNGYEVWSALDKGLFLVKSSSVHNQLKSDIKDTYKSERHRCRIWTEFRTVFLSRPWYTISALAVALVTIATLIQTYAAVIGSNSMKPQFKP